jgi:predicted DCC family thiol-disulfide oxidoreductase YuxK
MRGLTVLYDERCGFCCACRGWLEAQRQLVRLEFLAAGSTDARRRYPSLAAAGAPEELVVVSDVGGVYRGADAWIMCLWALHEFRAWSFRFANPLLRPLARSAFDWVSHRRAELSRLLRLAPDETLAERLSLGAESCRDGGCAATGSRTG